MIWEFPPILGKPHLAKDKKCDVSIYIYIDPKMMTRYDKKVTRYEILGIMSKPKIKQREYYHKFVFNELSCHELFHDHIMYEHMYVYICIHIYIYI